MKKILLILTISILGINLGLAQQNLTLQDAINIALNNNPGIKAGQSQIREAEAKNMQAKSTFLPQANILSKYLYTNNTPGMVPLLGVDVPVMNDGTPTGDNITMHPMAPYPYLDRDILTFDFNIVYPIYTGSKRKSAVATTENLKNAYNQKLNETKASLVLKVKTAFYNYLMIREVIKVYNDALKELYSHLALAEKAKEEGMRSEFDVLNFKSKIEGFKSKIINLKGKQKVVKTALRNLLSLPDSQQVNFVGSISEIYNNQVSLIFPELDSVLNSNYKVKYLNNMQKVLANKKEMEQANNKPVLFAFGNYHINHGKDFPPFDVTWRNGYAIGVGLKINVFDGNMTKGKIAEVKATQDKIANYEEGLKLKLSFKYQKTIETIKSLKAEKAAYEKNLEVAQKAYEIVQVGYENGVNTNIELNDAQLNVTKIKTSIINIEKQIMIQYSNLEYLNGKIEF